MSTGRTLSREAVAEVDVSGQFDEVLDLPEHMRDALWRVESANLAPHDSPGGLVIAGVGGSSAGGALARAALGDSASRPIALARDYALPGWTTPDTTVLCASSDYGQLASICSRVLIFSGGRIVAALVGSEITKEAIAERSLGALAA